MRKTPLFAIILSIFVLLLPATTAFATFDIDRIGPIVPSGPGANRILPRTEVGRDRSEIPMIAPPGLPSADKLFRGSLGPVNDAPVDYNGDGRTDFVVVRNTGGGPNGQLTWFYQQNGGAGTWGIDWGLDSDWILSDDFDGDLKDDVTIWRPGPSGEAAFYILQSLTSTVRIDYFGQTGDVPSIIADFDGDNKADTAVFRVGTPAIWFYRGSFNNPGGNVTAVAWGSGGDVLAPGDYDGDGKNDFGIARNGGAGQLEFWRLLSTGVVMPVVFFGSPSDLVVPGDYDGDDKTDIATVRGFTPQHQWQYLSSLNGSVVYAVWGTGNDFPVQGDYDGDGKTDIAIWRRSSTPGQTAFWALQSSNGSSLITSWGISTDFPAASWNVF